VALGGSIGRRSAPDETDTFGGVRLAVALTPIVALIGAAEDRYASLIDGKDWLVPAEAPVGDDGFGGKTAWPTVKEPTRNEVARLPKQED
jgi:hypothetical protein